MIRFVKPGRLSFCALGASGRAQYPIDRVAREPPYGDHHLDLLPAHSS
jgi:hypothetical protein